MKNDERWLRELIQVNQESREQDRLRLDERWDRLSSGELSPEEEEELRALAGSSEEGREAWEAFRPLGPDFQASVVRAIRKPVPVPLPLPLPPRTVQRVRWGSLAKAAAAILVFVIRPPAPPLPDYSPDSPSGGTLAMRGGAPEAERIFAPGDRIGMVLRPATGTPGEELSAECFLRCGRDQRRLEVVQRKIDPDLGTVQMKCSIDRDLPPGTCTLFAVVGRGRLPTVADLPDPGVKIRKRNWVAMPAEIRIQPRRPPP